MGHLKDIANQSKIQSFPSATFEIAGDVPAAQCSEAKIEGDHGITAPPFDYLEDVGAFAGFDLTFKLVTVISPAPNAGTKLITNNTNDRISIAGAFAIPSTDNVYYVHNGGELILTRDIQSFAEFIHAAGYAYTIKGAKLYTNIPSINLQPACTIVFAPLT